MKSPLKLALGLLVLSFAFIIAPLVLAQQDGGPISYGDSVTGEITNDVREIRYTFEATAGDTIIIRMNATPAGLDSYVNLYDESGAIVANDDDAGGNYNSLLGPISLANTGTYTIGASRCCSVEQTEGSVGGFTLSLEKMELPTLTTGETVSVSLVNDERAYFTIPAGVGSVISVQGTVLEGNDNFYMTVLNAASGITNQGFGGSLNPVLIDPLFLGDSPATLTLQLEQQFGPNGPLDSTGRTLTVGVTLNTVEIQPIEIGSSISGVLTNENPSNHYTFEGTASSILRLSGEIAAGDQALEVSILDSNGQMFNSGNTQMFGPEGLNFTIDPLQLPFDGQFMLLVRRLQFSSEIPMGTTNYTVSLGETQTPLLESGVEIMGNISEGTYEQVYRLNAEEGQTLFMTLRSVETSYKPSITITGPNTQSAPVQMDAGFGGAGGGFGGGGGYVDNFVFSGNSAKAGTLTYEWVAENTGVYLFRVNTYYGPQGPSNGQFGLKVDVR